ncbi:MAG: hypothetical protein JRJ29_07920, partial [Deltaproteobacteria bacterium]|nr:hypothetical protein [Deltaproteobacteria bacterium]
LEFRLRVVTASSYIRACEIIKENLEEIGIKVNIRVTEPRSLYSAFIYSQKHDYDWDLFVHGSNMSPDPDHFARTWATIPPGRWTNNGAFGWKHEALQTLLDRSRREMDEKKRWEMIQRAQEMFADELVVIMLAHKHVASAYRTDKFVGWKPTQVMYGAMYHSLLALPNILSLRPK